MCNGWLSSNGAQMKSIARMIHTLEQCEEEALDDKSRARLRQLREERDLIRAGKHEAVTGGFVPKSQKRQQPGQRDEFLSKSSAPLSVSFNQGPAGIFVMQHQEQYQPKAASFQGSGQGVHVFGQYGFYGQQASVYGAQQASYGQQASNSQQAAVFQHPQLQQLRQLQEYQLQEADQSRFLPHAPVPQGPMQTYVAPTWHSASGQPVVPPYSQAAKAKTLPVAATVAPGRKGSLQDVLDGAVNLASLSNSPPRVEPGCLLPPIRSILSGLQS